jgi:hypothetical protein
MAGVSYSYVDSHTEDVTQVRFDPTHLDTLFSASVDGLICKFDCSMASEDDSLLSGMRCTQAMLQHQIDPIGAVV